MTDIEERKLRPTKVSLKQKIDDLLELEKAALESQKKLSGPTRPFMKLINFTKLIQREAKTVLKTKSLNKTKNSSSGFKKP